MKRNLWEEITLLQRLYRDPLVRIRAWEARRRMGDYAGAEAALQGKISDLLLLLLLWVRGGRPPMLPN